MWLRRRYDYCGALSLVNFVIGAYVLFFILGGSKNRRYPRSNIFTYLVVKIRIAVSLLYLWKSWGALDVSIILVLQICLLMKGVSGSPTSRTH